MIDIGWSELLVIGIVALIVVGPKDLPIMFRRMGEFTGKARAMAREFSSAMDKAADEAGVKDMQRDLRAMANPKQTGLDAINRAARDLEDMDDDAPATKPASPPPLSPERAEAAEKIRDAAARKATERQAREAAEQAAVQAATDDKAT